MIINGTVKFKGTGFIGSEFHLICLPARNASCSGIKLVNNSPVYELYDCGVVYYPASPYLLCAVAQGKNLPQREKFLSELGKLTYEAMNSP